MKIELVTSTKAEQLISQLEQSSTNELRSRECSFNNLTIKDVCPNAFDFDQNRMFLNKQNKEVWNAQEEEMAYKPGYASTKDCWVEKNLHGSFEGDRHIHSGFSTEDLESGERARSFIVTGKRAWKLPVSDWSSVKKGDKKVLNNGQKFIKRITKNTWNEKTNPTEKKASYGFSSGGFDITTALSMRFSDNSDDLNHYQDIQHQSMIQAVAQNNITDDEADELVKQIEDKGSALSILIVQEKEIIQRNKARIDEITSSQMTKKTSTERFVLKAENTELVKKITKMISEHKAQSDKFYAGYAPDIEANIIKNFKQTSGSQSDRQIYYETSLIPFGGSRKIRALQLSNKQNTKCNEQTHHKIEGIKKWTCAHESYKDAYKYRKALVASGLNFNQSLQWNKTLKDQSRGRVDPLNDKITNWFNDTEMTKRLKYIESATEILIPTKAFRKLFAKVLPDEDFNETYTVKDHYPSMRLNREALRVFMEVYEEKYSEEWFNKTYKAQPGQITVWSSRAALLNWLEKNRPEKVSLFNTECPETSYSLKNLVMDNCIPMIEEQARLEAGIFVSSSGVEEFLHNPMAVPEYEYMMDCKSHVMSMYGAEFVAAHLDWSSDVDAYEAFQEELSEVHSLGSVGSWFEEDKSEEQKSLEDIDYENLLDLSYRLRYAKDTEIDEFSQYSDVSTEAIDKTPYTYWSSDTIPRNGLLEYQPEKLREALEALVACTKPGEVLRVNNQHKFRFDQADCWKEQCRWTYNRLKTAKSI